MNSNNVKWIYSIAALLFFGLINIASAQAEEKKLKEVHVIAVKQEIRGTLTVPNNEEAEEAILRTPGGVNVVPVERFEKQYTLSLADTLARTPGVIATSRYAEQVRLSIRGSGLARSYGLLGIRLFQDGVPFNGADGGTTDFNEIDTLAIQRFEIFKGGNAMGYGGTTLGGAANMVTKTGRSQPGHHFRAEFGSDDTYRVNVQSGLEFGRSDLFASLTAATSDGFRDHSEQETLKFNTNYGLRLSDSVETRFYLTTNVIAQQLPETISLATLRVRPETSNFFAIPDNQQRDFTSVRLANKTTFDLGHEQFLDVGAYVNIKNVFHPIINFVGVIDQESVNYGVYGQAHGEYHLGSFLNRYRAGVNAQLAHTDALLFGNVGGYRTNLKSNQDQYAHTLVWYGENHFYVTPEVALVAGGQVVWANRDLNDNLTPAASDSADYVTFNPKVGIMYEPNDAIQVFASINRSYEPPDYGNLTQGGTTGFTPLAAQKAWTGEIGSRGHYGPVAWDVTLYRAWIDDEYLQFTTMPGIPAATFNAIDTIHQGVELGLTFTLGQDLLLNGDSLKWENAYTYSDFFFEGDPQWGDNTIPGQPPHFFQTELRYAHRNGWYVAPNVQVASTVYADFANTLEAPDYAVLGLNAGYTVNEHADLFFSAVNLTDEEYVSNLTTITTPNPFNTAVFFPGNDRRFFGGVRLHF